MNKKIVPVAGTLPQPVSSHVDENESGERTTTGNTMMASDGGLEFQINVLELKKGEGAITYEIEQVDPSVDSQSQLDANPPRIRRKVPGMMGQVGENDNDSADLYHSFNCSQPTKATSWSLGPPSWSEDDWETVDHRQELPVPHKCEKCDKLYLSVFQAKRITNWGRVQLKCKICSKPLQPCYQLSSTPPAATKIWTNTTP